MTYADEEFLPEGQVETPSYPTAFGITFTPRLGGIIFALLGLAGAGYLLLNVVQPEFERSQTLKNDITKLNQDIQNLEAIQKKIEAKKAELEQAKVQNKQVLALFGNEKTLDTLLLDLNNFIKTRNGSLRVYNFGENPPATDGVIRDGSWGPQVNDKLKRKTIGIELVGSFDEIVSIMRNFERLQSLLLVKDFKLSYYDEPVIVLTDPSGKSVPGVVKKDSPQRKVIPGARPDLTATFKLEFLSPASQDAQAGATKPGQTPGTAPQAGQTPGAAQPGQTPGAAQPGQTPTPKQ
jgi:type IV pilus assembly protein PilO